MMNIKPVSIYIITRMNSKDRGEILRHTCEVALKQDYPDFEVVVSDNGGPYSALDALDTLRDVRLKIFRHDENTGFSGNMNRCLEHCSHDIIKPLCDDDLLHPDFLRHTVPYVDDQTLVLSDMRKYDVGIDPEALWQPVNSPIETDRRTAGYGADIWSLNYHVSPSAILYTRKLFDSLGGIISKSMTADWDFLVEVCMYKNVVRVQKELCFGGVWTGSLTKKMDRRPFFFPTEGLETFFRVYHCKPLPQPDRRKLSRMLFRNLFLQCLRVLKHPFSQPYWSGFIFYVRRFFRMWGNGKSSFAPRPNDSI